MSNGGRWNRKVQFTWKNQLREPDPPDFKFVDKESELVIDPLYSGRKVDQRTEKKEKERTQLEEESKEKGCCKDTNDVVTCVMWAKNHDLEQCEIYLTNSADERSKYLPTKRLCYGYLKPVSQLHTARDCNQRRTCKVCILCPCTNLR